MIWTIAGLGIIALVVFLFMEYRFFNLTLDLKKLIITGIILGGLIGALIAYILRKKLADSSLATFQLFLFFMAGGCIFGPFATHLTNRVLPQEGTHLRQFEFFEVQTNLDGLNLDPQKKKEAITDRDLIIVRNRALYSIEIFDDRFDNVNRGDLIQLKLKKGFCGYEFVIWDNEQQ